MLHAGLVPDVVFTQALQAPGVPAIGPAIAHVGQGETAPAQHQGAQCGQQRLAALGTQPAILCQQQAVEGLGHAPGSGRRVVIHGQRLQAGASGEATVGALTDAIGKGEQVALAGGQLRRRRDQAQGILVLHAWPGGAGLGEAELQAHGLPQTRAAVTAAEPQVVRQRCLTPYRPNQASTPRLANIHRPS